MKIIPKPHKFAKLGGEFTVTNQTKIFCEPQFSEQAARFVALVKQSCGFEPHFAEEISSAQIILTQNENCPPEGYFLMISDGVATVSAQDNAGCFYAVETLRQLFELDKPQENLTYGNCYIEDFPKFGYRGLSVDICRHFFPVETLKTIVDLMGRVKLNKLHLHLSDDQGFRLEIEKYPLLNTVGSVRAGSEVLKNGERTVDQTPVCGYLTKQQARELVAYAAERNVEVVPELDIPGHSAAMIAAYPTLGCEPGTVFEVRKKWGICKDILCAGSDETYNFVKDVLDEICEIFPSKYVHLGGDEAPKDRWCNCKKCRAKVAELKLANFEQLQTYMVEQFREYIASKGKTVICWNDGIAKNASAEIVSQVWKPLSTRAGIKQANSGRKTVLSPFFYMYFDYPYAMTPLKKTYRFNPLKGVKKDKTQNILGVEGTIWTEYIADEEKLFFNLLPRMLVLAEVGWGTNTGDFARRADDYVKLYDQLGLTYYKQAMTQTQKRVRTTKEFFKQNPNVELDEQNKNK